MVLTCSQTGLNIKLHLPIRRKRAGRLDVKPFFHTWNEEIRPTTEGKISS